MNCKNMFISKKKIAHSSWLLHWYSGMGYSYDCPNFSEIILHRCEKKTVAANHNKAQHIGGLMQDCSDSSVLAMELLQSCIKPSIWWTIYLFLGKHYNIRKYIDLNIVILAAYRWFSASQQYLHCGSNGDTAALHQAIGDFIEGGLQYFKGKDKALIL